MSAPDDVDEGWDDGGGGDESGGGGAGAATPGGPIELGPDGQPRRKRRRRRRGRGGDERGPQAQPSGGAPPADQALQGDPYAAGVAPEVPVAQPQQARAPQRERGRDRQRGPQQPQPQSRGQQPQPLRGQPPRGQQQPQRGQQPPQRPPVQPSFNADGTPTAAAANESRRNRGGNERGRDRGDRFDKGRDERRREVDGPAVDLVEDDVRAQSDLRTRAEDAAAAPVPGASVGGALRRNDAKRDHDDDDEVAAPQEAWGTDDGSPAPPIALKSELPEDPPADEPDPSTHVVLGEAGSKLGEDVLSVVGVRFVPAGRITWFDAADVDFTPGERVLVDAERGTRLGWIATMTLRRGTRDRGLRRVIRRASEQDLRGETEMDDNRVRVLRTAKDKAAALRLPLKVFRVEVSGGKLVVYYTSDERMDLRDFVRDVGQATGMRPELRQLGVRDEAKAVGGIGSCGLTLCCTTWMPDFVPVSIKMAKDQGLVLSPTKVSGQCGRLKCCLVYEQAAYAEMRKGLPKLGKRVVGARGEGRVVEVDVLRQRLRVSYGPGDTEVVPAAEVTALFPAANPPPRERGPGGRTEPRPKPPEVAAKLDLDAPEAGELDEDSSRDPNVSDDDDDGDPSRDPNAED